MSGPCVVTGLTWDHPRAYEGLEAETERFNRSQARIRLVWERHSLRGFESAPIVETTGRYDLVILDHPFMGDAAATGCLVDLSAQPALAAAEWTGAFVGPSLASYGYGGGLWAMPIDAACQVAAVRPDLLDRLDTPVPETIDEVLRLAARAPIALAMACPHAFMNFLTLAGLLGADLSGRDDRFLPRAVAEEAVRILRELASRLPVAAFDWSSIGALDAMAAGEDIAYCPMVFAFNSYARPGRPGSRIRFTAPPRFGTRGGTSGAVAGGTGLAVSSRSPRIAEGLEVVAHFAGAEVQTRMAVDGGQPAHVAAWEDPAADRANGGFFSACRATMEGSRLRPRYAGYMAFQNAAGDLLRRDAMERARPAPAVVEDLERLYRESRRPASGA